MWKLWLNVLIFEFLINFQHFIAFQKSVENLPYQSVKKIGGKVQNFEIIYRLSQILDTNCDVGVFGSKVLLVAVDEGAPLKKAINYMTFWVCSYIQR